MANTISISTRPSPIRNPISCARSDKRPPADGLDGVEQKMTAIEQRDRKQVQQPDRYREHGGKMHQGRKADRGDLT